MDSRSSDSALDQRCVGSIGRLTRISWSVATTRHPVQSSTFSVWNIVDTRSNNALRPSRARPHKKETLRESGRMAAHVRKIEILNDEKTLRSLRGHQRRRDRSATTCESCPIGARTALTFVHSVHQTEGYEHCLRVWAGTCAL